MHFNMFWLRQEILELDWEDTDNFYLISNVSCVSQGIKISSKGDNL